MLTLNEFLHFKLIKRLCQSKMTWLSTYNFEKETHWPAFECHIVSYIQLQIDEMIFV